ncbi:MAG: hypothetical protein MZW92_58720 [Comamonadaceae bacterium]|nr:hypothetical protein [Comamonadaceae bacterium]
MLRDREHAGRIAVNGRAYVESHHSWSGRLARPGEDHWRPRRAGSDATRSPGGNAGLEIKLKQMGT